MQCQHLTKTERPCKNEAIGNSEYCYLKSHHPNREAFDIAKQKVIDQFKHRTEDPNRFEIRDVDGDGACLYRSFAQAIYKRLKTISCHPLFEDIQKIIEGEDDDYLSDPSETLLANFLQKTIKDWLYKNQNHIMKPLDCKVRDLVESTHDMSMEIYRIIYGIFAGDADFLMVQKDGVHSVKKIPFRWGGTPEQYAFTQIFGFTVNIYDLITLDRRKWTIKAANFRHKVRRLRLLQNLHGSEETLDDTVNLFYTEIKGIPHYMYLHE